MAFADEAVKDGTGAVFKMDISIGGVVTYRYSTAPGVDSTNDYDPRIASLGRLTRGLGADHIMQASSVDVTFANSDEAADWMCDRANGADMMGARIELYIGLYSVHPPSPSDIQWKKLGNFVFAEFPTRDERSIRAILADDSFGLLEQPAQLPTLLDWRDGDQSQITNPTSIKSHVQWAVPPETPIPLAFGEDEHECIHPGVQVGFPRNPSWVNHDGRFYGSRTWAVCCTTSTEAISYGGDSLMVPTDDVTYIFVDWGEGPMAVPREFNSPGANYWTGTDFEATAPGWRKIWDCFRGDTFTKAGRTYQVIFVLIYLRPYFEWRHQGTLSLTGPGSDTVKNVIMSTYGKDEAYNVIGIQRVWAIGSPLSAVTNTTVNAQTAADVIRDLIGSYSPGSSANIDTTSFDRVKNSAAGFSNTSLTVTFGKESREKTLREYVQEVAASHDIDVFTKWDGTFALTARNLDYSSQTGDFVEIVEEDIARLEDGMASREQRAAPYNRVFLERREGSPIWKEQWPEGPFDSPGGEVETWGRPVARTLSQSCRAQVLRTMSPWNSRNIEAVFRNTVRFTTTLRGLLLELGDYFRLTWTRNQGSADPYESTIFQVEELALDCERMTVDVVAVWSDDLRSTRPYLLDNESFLTRVSSSGGRTATVSDTNDSVTFSSGNLMTDGVEAGDHLILMDATQGASTFSRFRALKIASVDSATELTISDADLDFDAPSGAAVATWEIRRSHLTYPTEASDPTNYPDGGDPYGRVANATTTAGVYSANGTGGFTASHKLLDG